MLQSKRFAHPKKKAAPNCELNIQVITSVHEEEKQRKKGRESALFERAANAKKKERESDLLP